MLEHCTLCPRLCGANRNAGEHGFCGADARIRIGLASLHQWEEPCLSGTNGAGTVFFCHCPLGCVYCQNHDISGLDADASGICTDISGLADTFLSLQQRGAHNIDLVTPTQYAAQLTQAIPLARRRGLTIPIVYNCGGYERVETLRELEGLVDIYLPDMKYSDPKLAGILSAAPNYVEIAKAAIAEMYRQVGSAVIEDEIMQRGMIVRHLMLPGELDNTLGVLDWFSEAFPKGDVLFSLMSQYVPMGKAKTMPPYDRRITEDEYDAALSYLELLGIENGFTQDFSAATEEYIPDFSFEGL